MVCGASGGIGRACAVELASLGAAVTLVARDARRLEEVRRALPPPRAGTHDALTLDLSRPEQAVERVRSATDPDRPWLILVNNTGGPPAGAALDLTAGQLRAAFESLMVAAHLLTQALVPGMKAARFGRIINITSTSVRQPILNLALSNVVRAAVANWAKTLAAELGPFGITVNNVLPGYTATERLDELIRERARRESVPEETVRRGIIASIPAGRLADPAEIAAAVAFLASPAGAYITGINLPVDGGRIPCL